MLPRNHVKKNHQNSTNEAEEASDNSGAANRRIVVLIQHRVGARDETADRRGHETDRDRGALEQHKLILARQP
jgi:hypothetical protein